MNTEKFKKKLLGEKESLTHELSRISTPNPLNPADWDAKPENETKEADLNVAADMHEDVEERHGVSDELEKRLQNVNNALKKIEDGTYGTCEEGGEEIEEDRLEANPAASTCKAHMNQP